MRRLLLLLLLVLAAACSGPGTEPVEPIPVGTWRGTLVPLDGARSVPATLVLSEDGASLVAGSSRTTGREIEARGGRVGFRVESFPITPVLRRTLRCSLSADGPQSMSGICRASSSRYELRVIRAIS